MCALGLMTAAGAVQAATINLTDQNASFQVDTSGLGVLSMTVDGTNHIWEQDFLHDVTSSTFTKKISGKNTTVYEPVTRQEIGMADPGTTGGLWLQNPAVSQAGANQLTLGYTDTDVAISISFQLVGGATGSNAATIIESYTITNNNALGGNIAVNLFAFTDVDVGGSFFSSKDDRGELLGTAPYNQYRQYDNNFQMIATTDSAPDHYWVAQGEGPAGETTCPSYYQIKCVLYDTTNTVMPDTVLAGPADLQMVAQWVKTLAFGESFTYTHTMQMCDIGGCPTVSEVPVPAAVWLMGSGLLGLYGAARRRRAA
jgi:hypothetical protein